MTTTTMMRVCAILLAAAACAIGGAGARAENKFEAADCSDIPISFSGTGYDVKCYELAVTASNTVGRKLQRLVVLDPDKSGILVVEDVRYLGGYLERSSLIHLMKGFFSESLDDWDDTGEREGFDTAEYTGRDDNGGPADCVAFTRNVDTDMHGLIRFVIGFGCSLKSRQHIWDTLKMVTAPGG